MKKFMHVVAMATTLVWATAAEAQRPGGQRPGGQRGGPPQQGEQNGLNRNNIANAQRQGGGFGMNPLGANQNGLNMAAFNQNGMQNTQQVAQRMIANFDTDGSGELGIAELQAALQMLNGMMRNQRGGQDQFGRQDQFGGNQRGLGDQPNAAFGPQNRQPVRGADNRGRPQRGGQRGR
ncbi:MAG: hypothetical protein AAF802_20900 [Planctomycetota bacterium]